MTSVSTEQASNESGYPRSWIWSEDGLVADGTFVKVDQAPTAYGPCGILVLRIADEDRSVWANTTALRGKISDELTRRGARNFTVGERIIVERAAEKKTSASGNAYWPFQVSFPDGPETDAAAIFGASPQPATPPAADQDFPASPVADDNIPF